MRSYRKEINRLIRLIPTDAFECEPGCFDCCRIHQWTWTEWEPVQPKLRALFRWNPCPYASPAGCAVYEQRPVICRIYGLIPKLTATGRFAGASEDFLACKHGIVPKRSVDEKAIKEVFLSIIDIMQREAVDILNTEAAPIPAGPFGRVIYEEIRPKAKETAHEFRSIQA